MPSPIWDRIRSAQHRSSRLTDVRATLRAAEREIETTRQRALEVERIALDVDSSSETAEEARLEHHALQFEVRRLERAVADVLRPRIAEIEADESYARRRRRYEQVKQDTEALAAELREKWPGLEAAMIRLLTRIEENDREREDVNRDLPRGCSRLESPEAEARGLPLNFYLGPTPIDRLSRSKIVGFKGRDLAWPAPKASPFAAIGERERAQIVTAREENTPSARAARRASEDRRFSRYFVSQESYAGHPRGPVRHRHGQSFIYNVEPSCSPPILELDEAGVTAARAAGMKVEPAPPEWQLYRVVLARGSEGYHTQIDTRDGPESVASEPLECVMSLGQATAARAGGCLLTSLGEAEAPADAASVPAHAA